MRNKHCVAVHPCCCSRLALTLIDRRQAVTDRTGLHTHGLFTSHLFKTLAQINNRNTTWIQPSVQTNPVALLCMNWMLKPLLQGHSGTKTWLIQYYDLALSVIYVRLDENSVFQKYVFLGHWANRKGKVLTLQCWWMTVINKLIWNNRHVASCRLQHIVGQINCLFVLSATASLKRFAQLYPCCK